MNRMYTKNIWSSEENIDHMLSDLCNRCHGLGTIMETKIHLSSVGTPMTNFYICPDCRGLGYLDWCRRLVLGHIKTSKE